MTPQNFFDGVQGGVDHHYLFATRRISFANFLGDGRWGKFMGSQAVVGGDRSLNGAFEFGRHVIPTFCVHAIEFLLPKSCFEHRFFETGKGIVALVIG